LEFIYEYGLFLAKAITVVAAFVIVFGLIAGSKMKHKSGKRGELFIDDISEQLTEQKQEIKRSLLSKSEQKQFDKDEKKAAKQNKDEGKKPRLFVVEFNGDVEAQQVEAMREEISAIVQIAEKGDEVLLKLESPGGVVHGYGLAASQLDRLKNAGLKVTASVDKVAASGGYMMACVADKIISAPFAIIGSIGVVAQLPNINKLLKRFDVDIEQHTAGDYKRTLTVLGENTEQGRNKFKQDLEDTHVLFKDFVQSHRQNLDIEKVSTGEHWYGLQALDLNLVDEIKTSDDFILENVDSYRVLKMEYKIKQNVAEKLGIVTSDTLAKVFGKLTTWSTTNAK